MTAERDEAAVQRKRPANSILSELPEKDAHNQDQRADHRQRDQENANNKSKLETQPGFLGGAASGWGKTARPQPIQDHSKKWSRQYPVKGLHRFDPVRFLLGVAIPARNQLTDQDTAFRIDGGVANLARVVANRSEARKKGSVQSFDCFSQMTSKRR